MASADGNFFSTGPLNYLFLAEVLVVSITLVFFLFFWSRVVGTVLGWVLKIWLWRKHRIWIEFDALQISPLSGHILFKELKYFSANMSVRAVHGHIAWRYWIWRVREEGDDQRGGGEGVGSSGKRRKSPTRIILKVHGLEWCLFNRTPAFDEIIARMEDQERREAKEKGKAEQEWMGGSDGVGECGARRRNGWKEEGERGTSEEEERLKGRTEEVSPSTSSDSQRHHPAKEPLPTSMFVPSTVESTSTAVNWLREALPMEVHILTGGITFGNDATPSLLFLAFKEGLGTWEAAKTRSKLDDYKSVHAYTLSGVKLVTRTNPDYRGPILDHGRHAYKEIKKHQSLSTPLPTLSSLTYPLFLPRLKLFPFLSSTTFFGLPTPNPTLSASEPWKGLPRYRAGADGNERGGGVGMGTLPTEREKQYAKVTTLIDSKEVELRYYSDVAGLVPLNARSMDSEAGLEDCDVGNGDLAPEWGLDLVFRGGTITYGPWADRQRDALQKAFTPAVFSHSQPTPRLKPGEPRLHTSMKVFVKFEEQSTLLVPHRETSKDWEYDSEGPGGAGRLHSTRRHGLLAIALGAGSTMNYSMGMVASTEGYKTSMLIYLNKLVVTSSINTKEFVWSENCRVSCKMPSPLQWNTRRDWIFDVSLSKPVINLLRDHITQLSDLAKDWTSGPGTDFFHFVPYQYTFKVALQEFALRLNLNDHNIIDAPSSLDDNVFLVLSGPRLDSTVDIPSTKFSQKSTEVTFQIEASKLKASMSLPLWSTNNSFGTERTKDLGTFGILDVTGSYLFFSETDPDHVETLTIDLLTRGIEFKCFGWAIRHIFRIKDNYFGSFTNFTTLPEYREKKDANAIGDPVAARYRAGKADVFEIDLTVTVHEGSLIFPEDLHDCRKVLVVSSPEMQVSLRLHDYFMEVVFAFQPVKLSTKNMLDPDEPVPAREDAIMIDGLGLVGNRLFGPQPQTATYLCLWEADLGRITGHTSPAMLSSLAKVGKTFGLNFSDKGNSPPPNIELAVDPDITFFKVSIGAVDFTVWSPASAINVVLPSGLVFELNDLATESYRIMMSVSLPQLDARILLPPSTPSHNWWEVSALSLDLALDIYQSPTGWLESAEEQAAFVIAQDEMTRRVAQLYDPKIKAGPVSHLNGLYLPPPIVPRRRPVKEESYYISESEDETSASEAASFKSSTDDDDGDARSFRFPPHRRASGSASFFTAYEDDAEISDGDESDNSTSTDTSSSGDSTSTVLPTSKAVLQHSTFSAVLDRYRLLRPSEIFCGDGAAVKVEASRKSAAPLPSPSTPDPPPPKRSRHNSVIRRASRRAAPAANRVVRVSSRKDLRFLFTPLSIGPLKELLTGLAEATDSPGQVLDDLVAIDASATPSEPLTAPKVPSPESFIIEVEISGIRVQSVLRVLTKAEVKAISESSSVARGASPSGDLHARIEWNARAIKLLVSSSASPPFDGNLSTSALGHESPLPSETSLDASLSVDSSILRVLQATSSIDGTRNPTPDPEVLRLTTQALVGTFSSTSDNTSLRLNIGDSNLDWLNIASELIIGTVHESLRFFSALDRLNEEIAGRRRARIRTVVWEILQQARTSKIQTSPACLRPASYLVQSSPTRSSLGWKFLCRLRHCLQAEEAAKGAVEFKELESNSERTDDEMLEDVLPILSDWWQDWPGSASFFSVDDIAILDYVFAGRSVKKPVEQPLPENRPPPRTIFQTLLARPAVISFTTGRLKANHRATLASDSTDGALIIGPYSFIARTWSEDEETSYPSPTNPRTLRIVVQSVLGDGTARITPALLHVIRHILKVRKVFESKMIVLEQAREQIPRTPSRKPSETPLEWNKIVLEATMGFKTGSVEVDVEELGVRAFSKSGAIITKVVVDFPSIASKRILSAPSNLSASLILRLQDLKVSAEQKDQQDDQAQLLAEVTVQGADSVLSFAQGENSSSAGALSAVFAVEAVRSQAPANIARLYEFSESWVKKSKNHQSTLEEIIKEFDPEDNPARSLKPHPKPELGRVFPSINLNILLKRLDFDIRITPRLWVCWTLQDVLAFVSRPEGRQDGPVSFEFGLQLGLQSLRFVPTKASLLHLPADSTTTSTMTVSFPSIKASGIYGKPPGSAAARVELVVTLDFVDVVFQPDVLDSLFAVFSQIGRDMSQLEDLLVKARRARSSSSSIPVPKVETPSSETQLLHTIRFALRGFKIGLKGPSSIQYIEASILQGEVSSPVGSSQEPLWSFSVDELALSLAQTSLRHASSPSTETTMDRRYRSAYVTVNFRAQNHPFDGPRQPRTRQATFGKPELRVLQVRLDQVHGTLQAAAVGELGDLFDHYGVELQRRKKQRIVEFEDIKSRAARVWQADEPQEAVGELAEPTPSWLEDREIQVQVQHVGFAFPLSREEIKSTLCSEKSSSVPAFVVSVRELNFTTRRDEDGAGEIKDVSLQFTSRFDQGDVNSFDGLSHQTYNRVHFPLLKGNVRSKSSSGLRLVSVDSEVSAFQLSLDSALPSYVFALIDVYEQGKKRLDRLALEHNFEQFYGQGTQVVVDHAPSISKKKSLEVQATFEFNAGHVSLYSYSDAMDLRGGLDGTPTSKKPRDPEIFVLPTVSMWCEYHDKVPSTSSPSSASSLPEVTTGPALLVNTTVHGTSNSISPDVLPFFVQIMHTIDHRPPKFDPPSPEVPLLRLPSSSTLSPQEPQGPLETLLTPPPVPEPPPKANMQISISLQINKSMLKVLTSREDLTEVTIAWESGGFIFNIAPGFQSLSMVGRVGGVTTTFINKNLHASDKEESLQASAQNLSLAISLSPEEPSGGLHRVDRRILSLTLDTEFSSSFDFVRFEDILCFKAVWLDRIPVPLASIPAAHPRPSRRRTSSSAVNALAPSASTTSPPIVVADLKSNLTTIVLVRIRKITQTVHSKLTTLQLDILDVVIRVRLAGGVEKYSFGIGEIKVQADRALTGHMSFPRLEFDVERRRRSNLTAEHSTLVSLGVRTGEIEANLMAGGNAILKLSCGPIALSITDDWTGVIGSTSSSQTIGLSFLVDLGTFNMAITTQTVPDLLKIYSGYLEQIDDAVRSAVRFSSSYARHHNAKPAQNLSAVANDFVKSTRTKLRTEAENVTFTIVQTMTLQSEGISVVLYAQSFVDKDLVRLDLGAVEARLDRTVAPGLPPETRLNLRLAFLKLKKWSSSVHPPSLEEKEGFINTQAWLKRATAGSSSRILLLPETKIMMDSTEDPVRTIQYDFTMSFGGAVDSSLNYAHLKWLGALITTFESKIQTGLARVDADRSKSVGGGSTLNPDRPTSATSDSDSSSSLLPKPSTAQPGSLIEPHSPFIYIARSEDIQELQLSHLGEATPSKSWVPWVQSQFSKSSKWTHEYATRPLVVLMEGLLGTYKKQLPKS